MAALFGNWIVGTCIALAATCDIVAGTNYLRKIRECKKRIGVSK